MLYFGSFNPIHRGHIALAEYAVEQNLCDEVVLVVSPRNPLKNATDLAPEVDRYEMTEIACAESKYPDRIKPSVIEFMLDRPSYTINTLRHLSQNYGTDCQFSILMGGDIIGQFDKWRSYEEILNTYNIYVYPRRGEVIDHYLDRITVLEDAPYFDYSSTEIREGLMRSKAVDKMLTPKVLEYIHSKELWTPESLLLRLTDAIDSAPSADIYAERGALYFHNSQWGEALNDFNRALAIDPLHTQATELKNIIQEILKFRHTDIYNP
ncbi:MAG: nicotinate (nicotinamide) nucleotide adenylyltransferase [Rikenellaceae bacterium]